MQTIKVRNLNVRYGKNKEIHGLNGFSADFLGGQCNVILGPSGSGKTTLLRAIMGLEKYDGEILFDGIDIASFPSKDRNIGYVNERIALFPHLSLFENIAIPLKSSLADAKEIRRRIYETAKEVGIEDCLARKPRQVSFGQCQRAAIAKAMIKKPNLYVFDEPFSSLDEPRAVELRSLLKTVIAKERATTIFVTHNLKEAITLGERFVIIDNGVCLAEGTQMELRANPNPQVSGIFCNDENFL